jgi:hypothetical protein
MERSDSSIIQVAEAREIAAAFGLLVAELNDVKRYNLEDRRRGLPFSLPLERLKHSKLQIQTAIAIVIADLLVEIRKGGTSNELNYILTAAITTPGDLKFFRREPIGLEGQDNSMYVFADWRRRCEECLSKICAASNKSTDSELVLAEYWCKIDAMVPYLLQDPVLVRARQE